MIKTLLILCFALSGFFTNAQSCEEYIELVKSKDYGTTYTSYTSTAISKVTFYDIMIDYKTYYFAIVCFKKEYAYTCNEYIYLVSSNTKMNYSLNYMESAGKAFWKYIHPYNQNLGCAPNFE